MKNLLFPLMVVLMLSSGCTCVMPWVNQAPTADIDSISPTEVSPGETVTFKGHGTDPDGTVVAYRWRSSVDGDLSTEANFETSSLSPGEHTVVLKVQDNNGAWSQEDKSRLVVLSGAVEVPVIVQYEANPGGISTGESSTLSWSVSGATTVTIDQEIGSVALTGSRVVSPGVSTIYTLAAANAAGSVTATAQVVVSGAPPPGLPLINYFNASPPGISAGETSTLGWNVSNATAVTISPGVGAVATAGSTSVAPTVTTIYALTATNAAGSVTDTTQVSVSAAPPFAVTKVMATGASASGTRTCPFTMDFSAAIAVDGPGTVTYHWEQSDSAVSPDYKLIFTAAGSKTVNHSWEVTSSGTYGALVRTLSPNEMVSTLKNVGVTCE